MDNKYEDYSYDVKLSEGYSDILSQDFWVCPRISGSMLQSVLEPVKMYSSVCIFVRQGNGQASVNLNNVNIKAPCIIHVRANQFMKKDMISDDFDASFIVMSKRLVDDVLMIINDTEFYSLASRYPAIEIAQDDVEMFENFYAEISKIIKDKDNPYLYQTVRHTLVALFYRVAYKYYQKTRTSRDMNAATTLSNRFVMLVEKNFREHRFLDFYADMLDITPKHLSRTVKQISGKSAVEWIEQFTILEAKLQLRYTNKTIQQIAEYLNFPSQSFFGKYFRKLVGMSPKEFRNSDKSPE